MSQSSSISSKKNKILVIESHESFGHQTVSLLNNEGYDSILVKDGADAIRMIHDILPRLIILNVSLPGSDSYDILEKKFGEPLLKKIPLFLVSTQGTPINMRRIPQGSVNEFIMILDYNPQEIYDRVQKYIKKIPTHGNLSAPATPPEMRKKILWVEDDKLIGSILGKKLIQSGLDVLHAKTGEEALSLLTSVTPDAIILDLLLPGMGGFEILQKIHMSPSMKNIPVMILSNLDKQSDIDKAKMLGARKFLVKAGTSLEQISDEVKKLCL